MASLTPEAPSILPRLPEHLSAQLFAGATRRRLEAGETLFAAGDSGDGCYQLKQGLLKVVVTSARGEERILAILGPGAIAGELAIIDGRPRSASVFAIRDCELIFISRKQFEECMRQYPEACEYLVRVLASRLRETDETLAAATFLTVKARLARALLELADYLGEDRGSGHILIRHKIRQSDLAAMAGVAREYVNRVLRDWMRHKVVTRSSGYYRLDDIAALQRRAELSQNEGRRTVKKS
jgi:CRP/FNR family transcriptional regulator